MSLQSLPIELLTALMDSLEQARTDAARLIQRMTRGLLFRSKLTANVKLSMNCRGRRPILVSNNTITQLGRVWKRDGQRFRHLVDLLP